MPSYKFYRNANDEKLEENVRGVGPDFRFIKLKALTVSPSDQKYNFRLEISLEGFSKPIYIALFSSLHPHSKVESYLYFNEDGSSKAIALPTGVVNVIYRVIPLPGTTDFEINLNSEYSITVSRVIQ